MRLKGRWVASAAPVVARGVLGLLGGTCRFSFRDWGSVDAVAASDRPIIYALWHSRLLMMPFARRREREIALLVSASRDGEIVQKVMVPFGCRAIRGSSTRGGHRALRDLARAIDDGCDTAITPDGPRGPARHAKLGALALARMTGAVIVPVAYGATRARRARSWDGFLVPLPFSTVRFAAGEPIVVPPDASDLTPWRLRLEEELNRVTDLADGLV